MADRRRQADYAILFGEARHQIHDGIDQAQAILPAEARPAWSSTSPFPISAATLKLPVKVNAMIKTEHT